MKIKVYDFDKTIYAGDSMLDFYIFNLKRQPSLIRFLPGQIWHSFLFMLKLESRTAAKTHFFRYVRGLTDIDKRVTDFWAGYITKLKPWYTGKDHAQDVILTASPEFLIAPVAHTLQVQKLIATKMNPLTGEIDGLNCHGVEKVSRLLKELPDSTVEEAYGDRNSDMPVLKLAKKPFLVTNDKIVALKT